jgi:fibronectin-binding autotransporter adhesin
MAARYWVGGAGTWSSTNTTNWSTTSGGAGGASVPTSADTPTFDANSGTGVVTFTNGGVTVGSTTVNNSGIELSLGAAFASSAALTLTLGTFTTNNYAVTATSLSSSNTNVRTINLGSSLVTLSASGATPTVNLLDTSNLTFNAGTSQLTLTNASAAINSGGLTFYNVSFTSTGLTTPSIGGDVDNVFNNLTIAGKTSAGIAAFQLGSNQTINGTLTLSVGTNATMRTFLRSNTIGITRTLTCAAVASLADIDFRDITIAGAAAPVSGTRLGDCKGNSGITFDAAKTVYWVGTSISLNWSSSGAWSDSVGGAASAIWFPLAQDTATIEATNLPTGGTSTINAAYNIGTIDMSARTPNTMTLATGTTAPSIYGNWINGTGTTLTGTGTMTFAGRGSQTITSAGKTFTQGFTIDTPSGTVTLQDAFTTSRAAANAIGVTAGVFDANNYNVSLTSTSGGVDSSSGRVRTVAFGSGTWVIGGTNFDFDPATNLTVTGTGTLSFTSTATKNFQGGGIQTYPTLNQGGTGTLTVTGSNKFAGLTNTAIGRIQFTGGTTNEFTSFTISGALGNLLQLGSTNTTQAILKKPTTWQVGLLSTDAGNNTGLTFLSSDGTMEYLTVSYINGISTGVTPTSSIYYSSTNITAIYYGSTLVDSIYYGSIQVF